MQTRATLLISIPAVLLLAAGAGCGDGSAPLGPGADAERVAAAFDALADSITTDGNAPTADALRHAAELVRLTGGTTPVILTIDGAKREFRAVAEQLEYPLLACRWPADSGVVVGDSAVVDSAMPEPRPRSTDPGEGECEEMGVQVVRTLVAWEPERMTEVVRIVADTGSVAAREGVPDVMAGLPTYPAAGGTSDPGAPDSAGGGGGSGGSGMPVIWPGFAGEYLVRDAGSWRAVEGTQSNALESSGGACTEPQATFDWATFDCATGRFRFEFTMRVEPLRWERLESGVWAPASADGSHALTMGSSAVQGVRLRVVAWAPPPLPPMPPMPPMPPVPPPSAPGDSTIGARPAAR